jgi:hypothetical protein
MFHSAVDPHKTSGQNLFKQYVGKGGKIVLDVRWVHECIKAGALQTYQNNWGGCRVTGTETYVSLFFVMKRLKCHFVQRIYVAAGERPLGLC